MKIKSLNILLVIVIISTSFFIACKSLKSTVVVDGYLLYSCSSLPYANKTISCYYNGLKPFSATTRTDASGYFSVVMKKQADDSWFLDWTGIPNHYYYYGQIEFCDPYGCLEDTHVKYYILPPIKKTIVELVFNIDSTYNSSEIFSWATDTLNRAYCFSSGSNYGPFQKIYSAIFIDSISCSGYYAQTVDALVRRSLVWTFKNQKHSQYFYYNLCNSDTTKIVVNVH